MEMSRQKAMPIWQDLRFVVAKTWFQTGAKSITASQALD
jgi:hypothetical protein